MCRAHYLRHEDQRITAAGRHYSTKYIMQTSTVYLVISNSGDGSSHIEMYCDPASITRLRELADQGDERYASGDGLQVTELYVPCSLEGFAAAQQYWHGWADGELVENSY